MAVLDLCSWHWSLSKQEVTSQLNFNLAHTYNAFAAPLARVHNPHSLLSSDVIRAAIIRLTVTCRVSGWLCPAR